MLPVALIKLREERGSGEKGFILPLDSRLQFIITRKSRQVLAAASSTHSQAREGMDVRQLISPPYTVQDPRPWHDASLGDGSYHLI